MKCEQFNTLLHELTSERLRDAAVGQAAIHHADSCESCAAELNIQRHVGALLGDVAQADRGLEAPERVEATVLGAFRLAHGTANVVPMRPVVVTPATAPRRFSHRWMAAAAAIVVGFTATLVSWQAMRSEPIGVEAPVKVPIASKPLAETTPPTRPVTPPAEAVVKDPPFSGAAPGRGNSKRPIIPVLNNADNRAVPAPEPQELVTDFYSLVPASGYAPMEGGQLVRLQVPRASLASLGVPIPVGNPNGSVTADLVMGYDGVAHAIRFVQPNMTDERRTR